MVNVNFFTYLLIYLCKSKSQKVFAQFTDATVCTIQFPLNCRCPNLVSACENATREGQKGNA